MDKILDTIKTIVDRYGVKWLVAGGAIFAVYQLVMTGHLEGLPGVIAIGLIVVAYFIFRHMEHEQENEYCECEDCEDAEPEKSDE